MDRPIRSLLFIPGDSEKKIAKAPDCGADVVIFDLEDAVAPANKPGARELVCQVLSETPPGERKMQYWVRVNPLDTGLTKEDCEAIMPVHRSWAACGNCPTCSTCWRMSLRLSLV